MYKHAAYVEIKTLNIEKITPTSELSHTVPKRIFTLENNRTNNSLVL